MAQSNNPSTLTQANHIYLYRLLSSELGCGRQTFITRVEEVLASDRMTADDLGFESTRALLEELEEFVTLTVFKGGRIYATIVAQPEWDEALEQQAKADAEGAQAGARARRRGRTKTVRAVKPRRMKREEAQTETASSTEETGATTPATRDEQSEETTEQGMSPAADSEPAAPEEAGAASEPEETGPENAPADEGHAAQEALEPEEASAEAPDEPPIAFTVTYDPYAGDRAGETDSASGSETERGVASAQAPCSPPNAAKPTAASPDTPPSPEALASYPEEFAAEVHLPPTFDALLAAALPYGTSSMDALTQGYGTARDAGTLQGNRTQASFSFDLPESDLACTVRIKRRTSGGFGWSVCSVEFSLE